MRRSPSANIARWWGARAGHPRSGTFGLAPRRDCRVSRPRTSAEAAGELTAHSDVSRRLLYLPLRIEARLLVSVALIRPTTYWAHHRGTAHRAVCLRQTPVGGGSPEVIGVRCPVELGLSSLDHRVQGDRPAIPWLTFQLSKNSHQRGDDRRAGHPPWPKAMRLTQWR